MEPHPQLLIHWDNLIETETKIWRSQQLNGGLRLLRLHLSLNETVSTEVIFGGISDFLNTLGDWK